MIHLYFGAVGYIGNQQAIFFLCSVKEGRESQRIVLKV